MPFLAKLLSFFKPKPAPTPAPAIADTEFLEAVAKTWRARYQPQPSKLTAEHGQAA